MSDLHNPGIGLERVSAKARADACRAVSTGAVYDLGLPIEAAMPQGPYPTLTPFSLAFTATPEGSASDEGPFTVAMEAVVGALHTSTHIDAFVHVQSDGKVFGGLDARDVRTDQGFTEHGVETIPPIVTRAVVLDVVGAKGVGRLEDGYEVTVDDLERTLEVNGGPQIRQGDAVLVRTGKVQQYGSDPDAYNAAEPGVGPDAAIWLYDRGMSILGTDTAGTEPEPYPYKDARTTHVEMLVERGVNLIESLNLEQVAAAGIEAGLFICLPLRLTGATGSWVRPVLIV